MRRHRPSFEVEIILRNRLARSSPGTAKSIDVDRDGYRPHGGGIGCVAYRDRGSACVGVPNR
jgi:hypothetical protein